MNEIKSARTIQEIKSLLKDTKEVKINFGSSSVRLPGFLNLDFNPSADVDIICDLNKLPYPFEDQSIDFIEINCVVEHLQIHLIDFLKEAKRILKHRGRMHLRTDNFFNWHSRISYLFAKWQDTEAYHPFHTWILDYDYTTKLCKHLGFSVVERKPTTSFFLIKSLEKFWPNMFARYVDVVLWNHSKN
ncbi:MAG: methyltransferase domain-containing protein [archaeon]